MLSFQRPSVVFGQRVDGKSDMDEFTLVCSALDAFEYSSPVGQLLIVDGAEME